MSLKKQQQKREILIYNAISSIFLCVLSRVFMGWQSPSTSSCLDWWVFCHVYVYTQICVCVHAGQHGEVSELAERPLPVFSVTSFHSVLILSFNLIFQFHGRPGPCSVPVNSRSLQHHPAGHSTYPTTTPLEQPILYITPPPPSISLSQASDFSSCFPDSFLRVYCSWINTFHQLLITCVSFFTLPPPTSGHSSFFEKKVSSVDAHRALCQSSWDHCCYLLAQS